MRKIIILKKIELLDAVSETVEINVENVNYGVIEQVINNEKIVTDTIEIKINQEPKEFKKALETITEFYIQRNNTIIIEMTDLTDYINNLYNVNTSEVFDFFECNIDGEMEECICFELI